MGKNVYRLSGNSRTHYHRCSAVCFAENVFPKSIQKDIGCIIFRYRFDAFGSHAPGSHRLIYLAGSELRILKTLGRRIGFVSVYRTRAGAPGVEHPMDHRRVSKTQPVDPTPPQAPPSFQTKTAFGFSCITVLITILKIIDTRIVFRCNG